jgi:hypothetical protein
VQPAPFSNSGPQSAVQKSVSGRRVPLARMRRAFHSDVRAAFAASSRRSPVHRDPIFFVKDPGRGRRPPPRSRRRRCCCCCCHRHDRHRVDAGAQRTIDTDNVVFAAAVARCLASAVCGTTQRPSSSVIQLPQQQQQLDSVTGRQAI